MDMDNYFLLETIEDGTPKRIASNRNLFKFNPVELLSGKIKPEGLEFRANSKYISKFDFLETGIPGIFLCSKRVYLFFTEFNINGCSFTPVKVFSKPNGTGIEYFILHIFGQASTFDYSKSNVLSKDNSFITLKGRFFAKEPITVYDIFVPHNTLFIYVNERLKSLIEGHGFTNLNFIRNADVIGSIPVSKYFNEDI